MSLGKKVINNKEEKESFKIYKAIQKLFFTAICQSGWHKNNARLSLRQDKRLTVEKIHVSQKYLQLYKSQLQ